MVTGNRVWSLAMNQINEDELKTNIKRDLDESTDALDANTLSTIRQIRAKAVEKASGKNVSYGSGLLIGGLATACIVVLAVIMLIKSPASIETVPVDELELISSSDNLEFYEDLEFYEWLEEDGLQS